MKLIRSINGAQIGLELGNKGRQAEPQSPAHKKNSYLLNESETNQLLSRLLSKSVADFVDCIFRESWHQSKSCKIMASQGHTLGEFEELVLLVVAAYHNEAYGVLILENLEEKLEKKVNISAVHVALKRLEDKGFVRSKFGGITSERGGRRKKFYSITALGKKVLDGQYALRTSLYQQIPKISFG